MPIRYTLLADGSSDAALIDIIDWLMNQHRPDLAFSSQIANNLGRVGLALFDRIPAALSLYPCDLLFVHRDAENEDYTVRLEEINTSLEQTSQPYVPIIPIRMTEAWLLSDETAIRSAAGNPSSNVHLSLPPKRNWENLSDPKSILFDALITAFGKSGRALRNFNPHEKRRRVAELTQDFSILRGLQSFDAFEELLINRLDSIQ